MEATGATRSDGEDGAVITTGGGETGGATVLGTGGGVSGSTGEESVENSKAGGADLAGGGEGLGLAERYGGEVVKRSTVAAGGAMDSPAGVDTTPADSAKGGGGAGEDTFSVAGGAGGTFADSGTGGGGRGSNGGDIGTRAGRGSTSGGEAGGVLEGDWAFEGSEGSFMRFMTFSES